MSNFEPNKRHLREILIYFFNLKKSAAEAHRLLAETYGEAALSERTCREWFQKFKNGKFDIEDKERSGRPKVYEDAELEALLDQDSCQMQEELARTLGVTQQSISHRLIRKKSPTKRDAPKKKGPPKMAVKIVGSVKIAAVKKSPGKVKKTAIASTTKTKAPKLKKAAIAKAIKTVQKKK